jgi:hypothetical protein
MMEKLVETHIRDEILEVCPLHRYNFAYQPGKSTETVQHHVIIHTEEAVENREVTPGAFLDKEGAFDSTSFDIITKDAKHHGLGDNLLVDQLHARWQENHSHTCSRELWRGVWLRAVHTEAFYCLCCGA